MMRINKRYSYCNKSERDSDPTDNLYLYDHFADVLYPRIRERKRKGRKRMAFNDFVHHRRLYLLYREDDKFGMLDLRQVYTYELAPTYSPIDDWQ